MTLLDSCLSRSLRSLWSLTTLMFVSWTCRALIHRPPPSKNPSICSLLTTLMVQTRRAAQLAAKPEHKHKPVDVDDKPPTKEIAARPLKRARKERHTDERASPIVVPEPKESERASQSAQLHWCFTQTRHNVDRERRRHESCQITT